MIRGESIMKIKTGVMKAVENMLIEKKSVSLPEMAKIFYPDDVDQRAAEMKVIGIIKVLRFRKGLLISYDFKKRVYTLKGKRYLLS
jgi:hypothetical protein